MLNLIQHLRDNCFSPKAKQRYGEMKSVEHAGIPEEQYGSKQEA